MSVAHHLYLTEFQADWRDTFGHAPHSHTLVSVWLLSSDLGGQNYSDFWLKLNIFQGNYCILRINKMQLCQKSSKKKLDFFSHLRISIKIPFFVKKILFVCNFNFQTFYFILFSKIMPNFCRPQPMSIQTRTVWNRSMIAIKSTVISVELSHFFDKIKLILISQVRNSTTHVTLSHTNLVQTTLRLPKSRVIPFFIPINHRWTRQGVTHNLSMFSPTFDITFLPAWEH